MSNSIDYLNWRYATKKFDNTKKISDGDLDKLLEATRLSASSYGLQPYHIFVISDQKVKDRLKPASWNQSQLTDASHVIVFANKGDFDGELIDSYLQNVSSIRKIPMGELKGYGDFMKSKLVPLSEDAKNVWTSKQTYLALGNLLSVAAEMKIDACPMEGFDPEQYNDILQLRKKGLNASVVVTVGYRSNEDETQHYPKVRLSKEELFTYI